MVQRSEKHDMKNTRFLSGMKTELAMKLFGRKILSLWKNFQFLLEPVLHLQAKGRKPTQNASSETSNMEFNKFKSQQLQNSSPFENLSKILFSVELISHLTKTDSRSMASQPALGQRESVRPSNRQDAYKITSKSHRFFQRNLAFHDNKKKIIERNTTRRKTN